MPHSYGYRARTRDMFKRGFKKGGQINTSTYLRVFKIGDIVDIVPNAAQHKSLPHKYYVGRTGVIYNISPRAVGVIIYKPVGNRYLEKRVNLRVEHVRISKCRTDFLRRVKENAQKKREAKDKGEKVELKRLPEAPRQARHIKVTESNALETLTALPYDTYI